MENKIYLKSTREWVEAPEDYCRQYYRENNALRKKQQYNGRCCCPQKKWWLCDGSCIDCEFQITSNDYISLDSIISDDEGKETSLLNSLSDDSETPESIVTDADYRTYLVEKLGKKDPVCANIVRLKEENMSEKQIAEMLGKSKTTVHYYLQKARGEVQNCFKDIE